MMKKLKKITPYFLFIILVPLFAFSVEPSVNSTFEITIDISPNVLNLNSNGTVVTVHTDIPYSQVLGSSLYLNGVMISSWKADNRGYFVAKFNMDDIKSLPLTIGDYNTLEMVGLTVDYEGFYGVQDILVLNNLPRAK